MGQMPEVQSEKMGQMEAVLTDTLAVQEQGELVAETKATTDQSLHSEALDEANLMIDGVILSDSELQELGDQELGDQNLGVQEQNDPVDEVTVKVPENKSGEEPNDEKASKKKEMKQEAATAGGVKKRVGLAFASPRKKLLAKVAAKQGDKARKSPPKA
ncbi:hypothetical protein HID58_058816 [Brassica napus]|uniref:Uncharacterized protein n=1 Tax=Brassica napus TaxID=3708 RepID=A0ABQ7ZR39_BRANA|nr:hypothetical protein HID58_058816 [Brassica napus]